MRLVLSAGETSGDQIGADLARALKALHPDIELAGIAGPKMRAAGVAPWNQLDELNIMGLTEVIAHLPRLVRLRRGFRERILDWRPDAFVGIDAPDFNLGLARQLRRRGTRSIHYVSPSVWAWRAGRVAKIARSLDLLLTLFPFEPELYRPHGLSARFVGHPLADRLAAAPDRASVRAELGWAADETVIALLPGSRDGEIQRHAELLAETAEGLRQRQPDARLVVLAASQRNADRITEICGLRLDKVNATRLIDRTESGLIAADVAVAASGTVTLEAFLLGCPLVVYYRLPAPTYWLARGLRLVKTRHVSLPNILTGRELVPERLQANATGARLIDDTLAWLDQPERRRDYVELSGEWLDKLAIDAGSTAARTIIDFIHAGRPT